jgi:hypothetical protein
MARLYIMETHLLICQHALWLKTVQLTIMLMRM